LLQWRELERRRGITVSLNKKVAAGHLLALGCEAPLFFLAGRGGEEEGWWSAIDPGPLEPLAGHGGEERRSSPWVTLAFSGGLGPPVEVPLNKRVLRVLLQPHLLRLPPPIRGRIGESEGGQLCIVGVAEESSAARSFFSSSFSPLPCVEVVKDGGVDWVSRSANQQWSWEAIFLSIFSAADCRPTSKANPWPIQQPTQGSGEYSTSFVRPIWRSATAYYGCVEASGLVPASAHDGGVADLRLSGGAREGLDCFFLFLSEDFSANNRDLYVFF
jgi:hypothetical protein